MRCLGREERIMIVFHYGLRAPTENADDARREVRAGYDYRRTMARLERDRRDALRMVHWSLGGEEYAAAELALSTAQEAVFAAYAAQKAAPSDAARADVERAREDARRCREALEALRRRADRSHEGRALRALIVEEHNRALKAAYAERPCTWGTAALIKRAHDAACGDRYGLYGDDGLRPLNIWVPPYDGTGAIRVQLMGGASPESVHGANTFLQIRRAPPSTGPAFDLDAIVKNGPNRGRTKREVLAEHPDTPATSEKRQAKRDKRLLAMRIDSDGSGKPIFAAWPMIYDRPIRGVVKEASIHVRMLGGHEHWSASIACDVDDSARDPQLGHGAVAVDLGWRRVPGGLRVACAVGEDGAEHELILPDEILESLDYASAVRSIRDRNRDRAVAAVLSLRDIAPDWYREATRYAYVWRDSTRLARLAREWASRRFDGDGDVYDRLEWWGGDTRDAHWKPGLEGWRRQDKHLWQIEAHVRDKAIGRRNDLYRRWIVSLARRYDTIVFEDCDLAEIAKRYPGDNADRAQSQRQVAAVGELTVIAASTFRRMGGCGKARTESYYSTHECPDCGTRTSFDASRSIHWTCSGCGVVHDQDRSAARVILSRERWCDAQSTERARIRSKSCVCHVKKEPHFAKLKRLKAEKLAREQTARELGSDAAE